MKLSEGRRWGELCTYAWDRSILYIFFQSILRARHRARAHPTELIHAEDVVDMPDYGLSLIWEGEVPYLFRGSLLAASGRGKAYKRGMVQASRECRRVERRALEGFAREYGGGIGE